MKILALQVLTILVLIRGLLLHVVISATQK